MTTYTLTNLTLVTLDLKVHLLLSGFGPRHFTHWDQADAGMIVVYDLVRVRDAFILDVVDKTEKRALALIVGVFGFFAIGSG